MTTKDYCSINFTGLTHDHTPGCRGEVPIVDAVDNTNGAEPTCNQNAADESSYCSAIPILKQHPMYDCLVLVRKYRHCLGGYSLEFPVDKVREHERLPTNESAHHPTANDNNNGDHHHQQQQELSTGGGVDELQRIAGGRRSGCSQRRLVSRFLDGDDPMYRATKGGTGLTSNLSQSSLHKSSGGGGEEASTLASQGQQQQQQQTDDAADASVLFMAQLDDRGDQCHLVHVPINGLLDRLESYTRNGIAVDSRVYAFAMGLKTAERMITNKSMKELHETPI